MLSHTFDPLLASTYPICEIKAATLAAIHAKLQQLESKLAHHKPEESWNRIQHDMESKYKIAAKYFQDLKVVRMQLILSGRLDAAEEQRRKAELCGQLDMVVDALRRDCKSAVDEYSSIWDELFVIKTNDHTVEEAQELVARIEKYLHLDETIYSEEFRKMEKIYELLDDEGLRLNKHMGYLVVT